MRERVTVVGLCVCVHVCAHASRELVQYFSCLFHTRDHTRSVWCNNAGHLSNNLGPTMLVYAWIYLRCALVIDLGFVTTPKVLHLCA